MAAVVAPLLCDVALVAMERGLDVVLGDMEVEVEGVYDDWDEGEVVEDEDEGVEFWMAE